MKKYLLTVGLFVSLSGFSQCYPRRGLGNVYNNHPVYVSPLILSLFAPRAVERPSVMYYYYPDADVYYNPTARSYSYYTHDGWITVENLPDGFPLPRYSERVYCYPGENIWSFNYLHRCRK